MAEEDFGERSPTDEQTDGRRRTQEVFDRAPVVTPAIQECPKANVPEEEIEGAEWSLWTGRTSGGSAGQKTCI